MNTLFENLKLTENNNYYVIAGDINARRQAWGDRADNQRGKYVSQWQTDYSINHKLNLITPSFPTFKPAQTFLDICMADSRLNWLNDLNGKARTLSYDSDAAVSFAFEIPNDSFPLTNMVSSNHKYNYKATKWDRFTRKLADVYINEISQINNLSINEIDSHLEKINNAISQSIDETVPTYKNTNSVDKYMNHKLIKIQKNKKYIVSLLHKMHIVDSYANRPLTKAAKTALKSINKTLQTQLKKVIENFWTNTIKNINYKKADSFFSKINSIFRPKKFNDIDNIHIKVNNNLILNRSICNLANTVTKDNEYIFSNQVDKLNVIGAYYETINSPRYLNQGTRLKDSAENTKQIFRNNRENNITLTQFNINNMATNPEVIESTIQPFCNPSTIFEILKHLPNKSLGLWPRRNPTDYTKTSNTQNNNRSCYNF